MLRRFTRYVLARLTPLLIDARLVHSCLCNETWTNEVRIQNKLDVFNQTSLRIILGVTWKDKIMNAEILTRRQTGDDCKT